MEKKYLKGLVRYLKTNLSLSLHFLILYLKFLEFAKDDPDNENGFSSQDDKIEDSDDEEENSDPYPEDIADAVCVEFKEYNDLDSDIDVNLNIVPDLVTEEPKDDNENCEKKEMPIRKRKALADLPVEKTNEKNITVAKENQKKKSGRIDAT